MKIRKILLSITFLLSSNIISFANTDYTYNIALNKNINSVDPLNSNNNQLIKNIYNTLVDYRFDDFDNLYPSIAEDWNISSDRKVYNFKIRKDIYFHNGRKLTAFDIKHTIERLANPNIYSGTYNLFRDLPIIGLSKYRNDCKKNLAEKDISGIVVLDDYLVQIKFESSSPLYLKQLAMPIFSIIPIEEVEKWGKDFSKYSIGTGPFKLKKFNNNFIELEKNEKYFEKGLPKINNLVYKVLSLDKQLDAFNKNQLNQLDLIGKSIEDNIKTIENNNFTNILNSDYYNDNLVSKYPELVSVFIGINKSKPYLRDIKVRQALNYSINKSYLISNSINYSGVELKGVIPSYFPNTNVNREDIYRYNPIKAKKLLYEAGLNDYNSDGILEYKGKNVELNLSYFNDDEADKVCKQIKIDLEKIGIKIKLKKENNLVELSNNIISNKSDLYHFTWKAKYNDPDKFYSPLFYSKKNIGTLNLSGFNDIKIDSLLDRASKIPADEFREKLYNNIDKYLVEKAPWIFLYQPVSYTLFKKNIENYKFHPILGENLKEIYISDNLASK